MYLIWKFDVCFYFAFKFETFWANRLYVAAVHFISSCFSRYFDYDNVIIFFRKSQSEIIFLQSLG